MTRPTSFGKIFYPFVYINPVYRINLSPFQKESQDMKEREKYPKNVDISYLGLYKSVLLTFEF